MRSQTRKRKSVWLLLTLALPGGLTCQGNEAVVGLSIPPQGFSVLVAPEVDSIARIGDWTVLDVEVRDPQGRRISERVTWASLDSAIARVSPVEYGTVQGLAAGTARITATYKGATDTALVVVAPSGISAGLTLSVTHSPGAPTTSSTVTISASASDPQAVTSTSVVVDGQPVETCAGGMCSYARRFALGSYTYTATATDTAGKTINAPQKSFTVWQPTTGGTTPGSPTSPHWPHARFAAIDFRIHYLKDPQKSLEYDQAAARYDVVIGGNVDQWKSRNPTVQQYIYDLIKGEKYSPTKDYVGMENWLTANGYPVENAYLHKAGGGKTAANRVTMTSQWGDYWALNIGDPGQIAWREHITKAMTSVRPSGYRFDGLFYDVLGSGSMKDIPNTTVEYANKTDFLTDLHTFLAMSATWMPAGRCMANTGNYLTPEDVLQQESCGAAMMEFANNTYSSSGYHIWNHVEGRLAAGTQIILVTQRHGFLKNTPRYNMNPGNYSTVAERVLLTEYANYLMLVDPAQMDLLAVDFYLTGNAQPAYPHAITWLKAFEMDIGLAVSGRSVIKSGTDGGGQPYQAFQREFENALVVYRPVQNWARTDFSDATAETINLPAGHTWRLLLADGSVTGPVTSIRLRNGEAAIFMK